MNATTEAKYREWATSVVKNGGHVTTMPTQAGRFAGKPGALYPADVITAKRLGPPAVWTAGHQNGYIVAPQNVWDSAQKVVENAAYGPDGPTLADRLFGDVAADNPLVALGEKIRALGSIAYWVVVLAVIAAVVLVLLHFNRKLATV